MLWISQMLIISVGTHESKVVWEVCNDPLYQDIIRKSIHSLYFPELQKLKWRAKPILPTFISWFLFLVHLSPQKLNCRATECSHNFLNKTWIWTFPLTNSCGFYYLYVRYFECPDKFEWQTIRRWVSCLNIPQQWFLIHRCHGRNGMILH